jgi:hypothetical protein
MDLLRAIRYTKSKTPSEMEGVLFLLLRQHRIFFGGRGVLDLAHVRFPFVFVIFG